ncbi:MAG: hypothetical protein ACM3MG_08845 [Bacillota bacterium]
MKIVESKKYPAPIPSKTTLFLRSFLPWQLLRFIIINLKMTVMIVKSHGQKINPKQ